jgi:hypothetical protein
LSLPACSKSSPSMPASMRRPAAPATPSRPPSQGCNGGSRDQLPMYVSSCCHRPRARGVQRPQPRKQVEVAPSRPVPRLRA